MLNQHEGRKEGLRSSCNALGKKVTDGAACDTPAVLRGGGVRMGGRRGKQAVCCYFLLSSVDII